MKFGTPGDAGVPQDMPRRRRLIYNGLVGNFAHSAAHRTNLFNDGPYRRRRWFVDVFNNITTDLIMERLKSFFLKYYRTLFVTSCYSVRVAPLLLTYTLFSIESNKFIEIAFHLSIQHFSWNFFHHKHVGIKRFCRIIC